MDRNPDAHHNVYINYYLIHVFIMTYAAPALCYGTYCSRCPYAHHYISDIHVYLSYTSCLLSGYGTYCTATE